MGSNWIYGVAVVREDDQFRAVCDEAPEAIAYGATEADALREMAEALKAAVRGRIHMKLDLVPPAGDPAAPHQIGLPAQLAAKASVYVAWRASGLSKVALGERLDRREGEVRRILDPDHRTGLDQLEEAAAALGGRLVVSFEAA